MPVFTSLGTPSLSKIEVPLRQGSKTPIAQCLFVESTYPCRFCKKHVLQYAYMPFDLTKPSQREKKKVKQERSGLLRK